MRRASQATIAEKLDISQMAVSKALRGEKDISENLRRRIVRTAKGLGYRTNRLARSLVDGKTHIIGVLLPTLRGLYFLRLVDAIQDELTIKGYNILLSRWQKTSQSDENELNPLLQYSVDGMIVVPRTNVPDWKKSIYASLLKNGLKIVFVNQRVPLPGTCSIYSDDYNGAKQAVTHLIESGHRHIALVTPDFPRTTVVQLRRRGYLSALRQAGIPIKDEYVLKTWDMQERELLVREFMSRYPEVKAFFCFNDNAAIILMEKLEGLGLRVPRDISIVGYGDNILHSKHMKVPFTTVSQSVEDMGKKAVEVLMKTINGDKVPRDIKVKTELIVRESTSRAR